MIARVYIDSSVFIWGYNFPGSNSDRVLDVLIDMDVELIITEHVIREIRRYFCTYYGKDIFSEINLLLTSRFKIYFDEELVGPKDKWKGKIKEKDLDHLAAVKEFNIPILLAYDEDFEPFDEYLTPRELLKRMGFQPSKTEY